MGIESIQSASPKGTESMQNAPPRGIESMQNVSLYKIESQQSLYLEEILTQLLREEWKGFNRKIKTWQKQRGYPKFKNT